MASRKVVKVTKSAKKIVDKVRHSPHLSVHIPAGKALPAPPLGPQLGQVSCYIRHYLIIKHVDIDTRQVSHVGWVCSSYCIAQSPGRYSNATARRSLPIAVQ